MPSGSIALKPDNTVFTQIQNKVFSFIQHWENKAPCLQIQVRGSGSCCHSRPQPQLGVRAALASPTQPMPFPPPPPTPCLPHPSLSFSYGYSSNPAMAWNTEYIVALGPTWSSSSGGNSDPNSDYSSEMVPGPWVVLPLPQLLLPGHMWSSMLQAGARAMIEGKWQQGRWDRLQSSNVGGASETLEGLREAQRLSDLGFNFST